MYNIYYLLLLNFTSIGTCILKNFKEQFDFNYLYFLPIYSKNHIYFSKLNTINTYQLIRTHQHLTRST